MKELFEKLRYKIAYFIAPDWIDDLENRLSGLLCEVTGGRLSKPYYSHEVMMDAVRDYDELHCNCCKQQENESILGEYKFTDKITEAQDLSDVKFIPNRDDALDWNEIPQWEESEDTQ